ncbi:MAG: NAD(P)H-hydrate dehydratase [Frankia sp.]|nr:NAD(P)H-hydrate dehydratase [Frankia sp.]
MRAAHTVDQVRAAEAPLLAALPEGALMQRAVHGLLTHAVRRLGRVYGRRVVVLAGGGDNGGDALWTGARLAQRGARVDAIAPGRTHPAGTAALRAAGGRLHPADQLSDERLGRLMADADLVLDGLLGIGGRPGLSGAYARLAEHAPPERTIAVDVPSGVDADTGAVSGVAVRAALTVTFGTYKRGLLVGPAVSHAGKLVLVDIGLDLPAPDLAALDDADVAALLPVPGPADSKYTRGVLGLVGGSDRYPGALVLATGGALRGGAGYLRVIAEARAAEHVLLAHPEAVVTVIEPGDADAMLAAGRVQAWALGPGVVPGPEARRLLDALLATGLPLLLDAGGLDPFAEAFASGFGDGGPAAAREALARRDGPVLLTPHEGEFARLTTAALGWDGTKTKEALAADRLGTARRAAAELGVTLLLKGNRTIVVTPEGSARVNTTGTPWLGTAGTGDVLTGLAGSLLAAGLTALDAASVAAYLHGRAGQLAPRPLSAADLPALLPAAAASVRSRQPGPVLQ